MRRYSVVINNRKRWKKKSTRYQLQQQQKNLTKQYAEAQFDTQHDNILVNSFPDLLKKSQVIYPRVRNLSK